MFGAGDRGPEIPGPGCKDRSPAPCRASLSPAPQQSVQPVGLGWLTVDGALVGAIFPARWACIAPSFSFSSTSCEDRHRVRPQPDLSPPCLCVGCGLPWECPAPFLPSCQPPSWVSLYPGTGWTYGSPTAPLPPPPPCHLLLQRLHHLPLEETLCPALLIQEMVCLAVPG